MATLAILTVGTREVQHPELDRFRVEGVGPGAMVRGREIGDYLERCDDARLTGLLSDERAVRNEPCFRCLDQLCGGRWTLAMLATDQPDSAAPQHRAGDTLGIAVNLERWFRLTRPAVRVLPPYVLSAPVGPTVRTETGDAVGRALRGAGHRLEHMVLLTVGGAPEMRLALERESVAQAGPSIVVHGLRPTEDNAATWHPHTA